MSVLLVVIAFSVMIIIHELGHFLVARKVGIRVEIFSIGFGPALFSVKKSGTEYRICALPFGDAYQRARRAAFAALFSGVNFLLF